MRYHHLIIIFCCLLYVSRSNGQGVTVKDSIQEEKKSRQSELSDLIKAVNYSSANNSKSSSKTEIWLSLGAVIISIFALILSIWQFRKEDNRVKREELRNIVEKLIDSRREYNNKLTLSEMDESERITFGDYYGKIFMVYLQAGDKLIESLDKKIISPIEYFILGAEFEYEGDFSRAIKYYEYARDVSTKTSIKNQETILRALGAFYYKPGPYFNIQLGKSYHQKAIDLFANENDEYLTFLKGFVYRAWAQQEIYVNNIEEAIQKIYFAYETIYQLPEGYPDRARELESIFRFWIDTMISGIFTKTQNLAESPAPIIGTPGAAKKMLTKAKEFYFQMPEESHERKQRLEDLKLITDQYQIAFNLV